MKREFLQNFKVGDQEIPKEVIDAIMDENGRDIESAKSKYADYDTIKDQLAAANQQIEGFKSMDIDGVRAAAEEWKTKYEQAQRDADEKISNIQFTNMLENAIRDAKGRNTKAVSALLDIESLKTSKNQKDDIQKALLELKKEYGYLFEQEQNPPPYVPGAGTHNITDHDPEMAAIRAAAGVKMMKENV